MLRSEFEYFIQHQDDLVRQYCGKVIVIKDRQVIGQYESDLDAYIAATKDHEVGTFLIQKCDPGPSIYTQIFQSRVTFV